MRAGNSQVPWPIVAVIVVVGLLLMGGFVRLLIPLLIVGAGGWLVVTAVQGLRAPAGRVSYWRGERIHLEEGRRGERVARSLFAIVLGLGLIAVGGWYLLR